MNSALYSQLQNSFGFSQFRPGQEQTIQQLLEQQSSLAIFPTGSGKSLCYQLTALQLPHLTLVVSPLLALIKDQLEFLASKGIAAASIDSTLSADEHRQVVQDIHAGKTKILMVSVERFKNERFRQFINSVPLSMLVVDEAHCISEWGHNFRPDYLKLPVYRQELNIPLVLLLTATATRQVKNDMAKKFEIAPQHIVQTGFYRKNLDLSVVPVNATEKNHTLLKLVKQQQGAGIIYVTRQQSAEQVAQYLAAQGVSAAAYHAGFDSERRQQIQAQFMANQVQVIVATIAFGMGIDKANIRFVIHYDLPKSIENYSQEIGRAGRDGLSAHCYTLANLDGINTVENFVYGDTPELSAIQSVLDSIASEVNNQRWEVQLNPLSNATNIKQLPLKTLLVQLELKQIIKPLYAYFAEFKLKLLHSKEDIVAHFNAERSEFINAIFHHTNFKKVWGELDFHSLLTSYACDRSRVVSALEYLQEQQLIVLETKGMTEAFSVDTEKLQQAELASTLHRYFVDKEEKEVKRIATLIRFFELDKCLSHNLSRYFDDQQSPAQCSHCSVCRGQTAKLAYSKPPRVVSDEELLHYTLGLEQHLQGKTPQPLTIESYCRFLAGISVPFFGRHKIKQLPGFACCEEQRYATIRESLQRLKAPSNDGAP
ncbi:RecQ-like ATP-dependent DNA helicase [Sinobacterium caligoides]|uniref:ATP-dependent DNA helicase RecQ n=1 Tax=Sinobacterium caligoides TaxID=933926 RepID=A0A3N2DFW2_9GAMM|nr:ATP-dependent DNA helicase RecQ [Sinobacterium caligoides]ROR98687.1 RecQ-like ATP-dependent DNA helicase [Sinobacterium caligoides]